MSRASACQEHVKKSPKTSRAHHPNEGGIHISNLKVLEKFVHGAAKK